jgi:hypothetical protein
VFHRVVVTAKGAPSRRRQRLSILEPSFDLRVPMGEEDALYTGWLMDCREFRNKHVAFVDDLLPAAEMRAMHGHRATCPRCSRHDTAIRRSLLIVRNLPPIEPSPDFMMRLNARLDQLGPESSVDLVAPHAHLPSAGALAALAAGVLVVAYMAIETSHYYAPVHVAQPAPAIASVPLLDATPLPMANSAFVASVPTGMPVWPAVLMAGQSPLHFASLDFHDADGGSATR